jgi:hypothetical protein
MSNQDNIQKLETAINRLQTNESVVYFLIYDTKNNPRAAVKHIYDMVKTLKKNGVVAKLLVEDKTYGGVSQWLGDSYNDIEFLSIKEDNVQINIDDVLVVPEYYSNALQNLSNINCTKIMLIQQKELMFEEIDIELQLQKLELLFKENNFNTGDERGNVLKQIHQLKNKLPELTLK